VNMTVYRYSRPYAFIHNLNDEVYIFVSVYELRHLTNHTLASKRAGHDPGSYYSLRSSQCLACPHTALHTAISISGFESTMTTCCPAKSGSIALWQKGELSLWWISCTLLSPCFKYVRMCLDERCSGAYY
jgi:hypothetical protein